VSRIALIGASGKMGQSLLKTLGPERLAGAVVSESNPHRHQDVGALLGASKPWGVTLTSSVTDALTGASVAIDFSSVALTAQVLEACVAKRVPLVLATTGLSAELNAKVEWASQSIALLRAANTSLGVAVLAKAVALVARALPESFQIDISEAHHQHKKDAPSGTALYLGETAAAARGIPTPAPVTRSDGVRDKTGIGYSSVRAGDIVGEHTVFFAGPHERLELTHRATNRDVFASGAVHAAEWLRAQPAGLYSMSDVLGLSI
jgi:4-hydroxy-tetrahydrodipicolinate reductase